MRLGFAARPAELGCGDTLALGLLEDEARTRAERCKPASIAARSTPASTKAPIVMSPLIPENASG